MDEVRQGLLNGWRLILERPGFCAVIVVTLALGISAASVIFSVIDAVLLRPLPFPQPDRLVVMHETLPDFEDAGTSYNSFAHWRERGTSFEGVAAVNSFESNLESGEAPERIAGASVSSDYFAVMGLEPLEGRLFEPQDFRPDSHDAVLISHSLRRRRFADDRVIGQTLRLDGQILTIVGVMPSAHRNPTIGWRDFWRPMVMQNEAEARSWRWRYLDVVARLKPGVSLQQARSDIQAVSRGLEEEFPAVNQNYGAALHSLDQEVAGESRPTLLILTAAVAFVLLITCSNVSSLLLSRATEREREIAIRKALGASNGGIIRQALSESVLLGMAGGLLGLALSWGGLPLLIRLSPDDIPRLQQAALDLRAFGFALLISLGASLLFGAVPAFSCSRGGLSRSLKEQSAHLSGGSPQGWRKVLVTAQIALALILLMGSVLMLQSVRNLSATDPGFSIPNVLSFSVSLPSAHYAHAEQRLDFHRRLVERLKSLPGVRSAAAASSPPLTVEGQWMVFVEGRPEPQAGHEPFVPSNLVSPGYFETLGIPLLRGRLLSEEEVWEKGGAILVNRRMADQFWPGQSPLGKRMKHYREHDWMTVVGVVGDVRQEGLGARPLPQTYSPYAELPYRGNHYLLRSASDPLGLVDAVRHEVQQLDPALPVSDVRLLREIVNEQLERPRFTSWLLSGFAWLAVILALVGIYGLVSQSVIQRRREIGLRMALGAHRRRLLHMVLFETLRLTAGGILLGCLGAAALTRLMEGLLYQVSPLDPFTFLTLPPILAAVSLIATLWPARQAVQVDPMVVLREE